MSTNEIIIQKLDKIISIMAYISIKDIDDENKKIFTLINMGFNIDDTSKLIDQPINNVAEIVLNKISSSKERKMVWVLLDGKNDNKIIAEKVKTSERTVSRTLKLLEEAGLIENPWGKPSSRKIDVIPQDWIALLSKD